MAKQDIAKPQKAHAIQIEIYLQSKSTDAVQLSMQLCSSSFAQESWDMGA